MFVLELIRHCGLNEAFCQEKIPLWQTDYWVQWGFDGTIAAQLGLRSQQVVAKHFNSTVSSDIYNIQKVPAFSIG